jgi:hypothetical protein
MAATVTVVLSRLLHPYQGANAPECCFYSHPERTRLVRFGYRPAHSETGGKRMIVLGIILLILGWLLGISILVTIGLIVLVIGVILWILGAVGRPVGGRRYWF